MGCTQISVSDILTVPEHKPDIESILRISTTAIIDKTVTTRKKIFFCGHVDICVEYAACACDCTQQIHFLHTEIPFKGLRLHRYAREHLESFLKAKIRFCESDMISTRAVNAIIILKLCKLKYRRIVKHPDPQCFKPFHDICDCEKPSDDHDCKPHHDNKCKPPSHKPDCKKHDSWDCKKPSDDHDCKPHHSKECKPSSHDYDYKPHHTNKCKPPSHNPDSMQHYSGYCKPPTYDDYAYKSHPNGNCKPHEYVSSEDFHVPTYIQPCKRMGSSRGISFGFNYED